jgi:hypothetical protein
MMIKKKSNPEHYTWGFTRPYRFTRSSTSFAYIICLYGKADFTLYIMLAAAYDTTGTASTHSADFKPHLHFLSLIWAQNVPSAVKTYPKLARVCFRTKKAYWRHFLD